LSSQSGLVSGQDVAVTAGAVNNGSGQMIAAGNLTLGTQALPNAAGLLQAAGNAQIDTHGQALVNTGSGNAGGIVAGGTLNVAAGSIDNQAGFIASTGRQTLTVSGDLDNRAANGQAGVIVTNGDSTITAANLLNQGGRINALGDTGITTGLLDNRGGAIAANGNLQLAATTFDNRAQSGVAGTVDATNISITATSMNNGGGVMRSAGDVTLLADTTDNTGGGINAAHYLGLTSVNLANSGGTMVGNDGVTVTTSSQSPGGTIASANDVTLNINGDYSNTGLLSSQRNLTLNATNISNSGTLTAGETLAANTGNLANSGEISGHDVQLNVTGTLTNADSGLIDGINTSVNAGTINNTGRIYGDLLRVSGGTVNNSGSGVIAARDTLLFGAQNLNNTGGGLIYSLNDIGIGGAIDGAIDGNGHLQGSVQNLLNASSKIEAGRNLALAATTLVNRNDGLTMHQVVVGSDYQEQVQPVNNATRYPGTLCSGIGGGQDDNSCIVHPDVYGQRAALEPARTETCIDYGEGNIVCNTQINYAWNSPVFAQFQIASVSAPPTEPYGIGGCTANNGDSGPAPVNNLECNQWRVDYANWDTAFNATVDQLEVKLNAYNAEVNEDNRRDHFEDYTWFKLNSTTTNTEVATTAPGQILSGGTMNLTGTVSNQQSNIVAGGALTVVGPAVDNVVSHGEERTDYSGTTQFTHVDSCGTFGGSHCRRWESVNPYNPAPLIVTTDLANVVYAQNAGNTTTLRNLAVTTTGADTTAASDASQAGGNNRVPAVVTPSDGDAGNVILTTPPALAIPTSNLFAVHAEPAARYLVETDPRFTSQHSFLSSDYFQQALQRDPERQLKRYGDGFTEQQLINDQILALTGRRFLTGYTATEQEYKSLMDAGIAFTQQYQLTPGVALSAEQMALLTTDVVLLTTRSVTLADGSTQDVYAPQVYLRRPADGDLLPSGALMAGTDVLIQTAGNLVNGGTIAGDTVTAVAGNDLVNQGRISGQDILLRASNDLQNLSGVISGTGANSNISLLAGRDIVLQTQTRASVNNDGSSTRSSVQHIATMQGNALQLAAGRDLIANGATVTAAGDLTATAAHDIRIGTTAGQYQLRVDDASGRSTQGRTAYLEEAGTTNQSATIRSGGNTVLAAAGDAHLTGAQIAGDNVQIQAQSVTLDAAADRTMADLQTVQRKAYNRALRDDETLVASNINAGSNLTLRATGNGSAGSGDLTLTAANVNADKGQAALVAGNDVTIGAGSTKHIAIDESYSKSSNLLSSKETTTSDRVTTTQSEGSAISGNTAALQAGKDLAIRGSTVVGAGDVTLTAQTGNVTIAATQETRTENHFRQQKQSGIFGSGAGIGFTIGSREQKSNLDGDTITESQSRSAVGTLGGNLVITSGKDTAIHGSDLIANRAAGDVLDATGHIDIQAQNITIDPGQDASRTNATQEAKSSGFTVALVGTLLDTYRNLKDTQKNPSTFGKVRGASNEIFFSALTAPQIAISVDHSHSSSQLSTNDLVNSGSSLTAAGDIRLRATGTGTKDAAGRATDGDISVTGSTLHAGSLVQMDAERNLTLQASTDHYSESSSATSSSTHFSTAAVSAGDALRQIDGGPNNSGVGAFPYGKANGSDTGNSAASVQSPTLVTGDNIILNSRSGDVRIAGSGLSAVQDLTVAAQLGKIDVTSGEDSRTHQEEHSKKLVGDLGKSGSTGTANTVGVYSEHSTLDTAQNQQSTIRSQLTAGRDLTLDAKDDLTIHGADLRAGRDLTAIGRNVTLDAGSDSSRTAQTTEVQQAGVTLSMSGYAVEAAQALDQAANAYEQKDNKRLAALYGAKAALVAYNGVSGGGSGPLNAAGTPSNSSGAAIKATVSIGSKSADSQSEVNSTQTQGSTLTAGQTISVIATGNGDKDSNGKAIDGDITARGTRITGTDVVLAAARDIALQSARDTTHNRSSDHSSNASIGIGFGLGGQQNGFTLELAAAQSTGKANGDSAINRNTQVLASDTVTLQSGRDTNLLGAQVKGDTVTAGVGRDLNIASQQDTDTFHSKQDSAGFSASLCVPPFCFGSTVSGSVSSANANTDSSYASVVEQSGLYAGQGGYDVTVQGNTDLKGAVIASTADAAKNKLVTGTLTTSDIENKADYQSDSSSLSLSYSGGKSAASGISSTGSALQTVTSNLAANAAGNALPSQDGSASGTTKSAISAGTVIITDDAGQRAKTGKSADDTIASLNRDTDSANGAVQKIFDQAKLQKEQEERQVLSQVAQQAAPAIYKEIGDLAKAQTKPYEDAQLQKEAFAELLEKETDSDKRASLAQGIAQADATMAQYQDQYNLWKDGGAYKVALHSLAGAGLTKLTGGSAAAGALAGAANDIKIGLINDLTKGLSPESQKFVHELASLATGAAIGGSQSAPYTLMADQYNRQLHITERQKIQDKAHSVAASMAQKPEDQPKIEKYWTSMLTIAAEAQVDAEARKNLDNYVTKLAQAAQLSGNDAELQGFLGSLAQAQQYVQQMSGEVIVGTTGKPIVLYGDTLKAFQATTAQYQDPYLLGSGPITFGDTQQALGAGNTLNTIGLTYKARTAKSLVDQQISDLEKSVLENTLTPNGSAEQICPECNLIGTGGLLKTGVSVLVKSGKGSVKELVDLALNQADRVGANSIPPKVTAKGTVGDAVFEDVNQTAKVGATNEPTLIADRIAAKEAKNGKPYPNGTVADSHAEIGVIQQAYNAGRTQGTNMTMTVTGKDVCGYCKGDIAAAAEAAGLKSLTIQATDNITGLPKTYLWQSGMKSIKENP
jgi:adhesin HecA-like repeat protein